MKPSWTEKAFLGWTIVGILLISNFSFLWFFPGTILNTITAAPAWLNIQDDGWNALSLWQSSGVSGIAMDVLHRGFYLLFGQWNISAGFAQVALDGLLTAVGGVAFLLLIRDLFPKRQALILLATAAYVVNPWLFGKVFFWPLGLYFAILPLWFFLIRRILVNPRRPVGTICLFLLTSPLLSVLAQDLRLLAAAMIGLGTWVALLVVWKQAVIKDLLRRIVFVAIPLVLLNGWWVYVGFVQIRSAWEERAFSLSALPALSRISAAFQALQPELTASGTDFHLGLFERISTNPIFLFALLLPLAMIFVLPLFRENLNRRRTLSVLLGLLVLVVILQRAAGHLRDFHLLWNPLGALSLFSEDIVTLTMMVWMPLAGFFAIGAEALLHTVGETALAKRFPFLPSMGCILILLVLGLQIHPLIINPIMHQSPTPLRMTLSPSWEDARNWLASRNTGSGIFELPDHDPNFVITQEGYIGKNPTPALLGGALKTPSSSLTIAPWWDRLVRDAYGKISRNIHTGFRQTLQLLNTDLVLHRRDLAGASLTAEQIAAFLEDEKEVKSAKTFGSLEFFAHKGVQARPRVYATQDATRFSGSLDHLSPFVTNFYPRSSTVVSSPLDDEREEPFEALFTRAFVGAAAGEEKTQDSGDSKTDRASTIMKLAIPASGQYQLYYGRADLLFDVERIDDQLALTLTNPRVVQLNRAKEMRFDPIRKMLPFSVPEQTDLSQSFFVVNGEMDTRYFLAGQRQFVSFDEPVNKLTFYAVDDRNVITGDPSFEQSAWEDRLADCNRSDDRTMEEAGIRASRMSDARDGNSALQLEARAHQACVSTNIANVETNTRYHLSFWVKRENDGLFPQWTIIERSAGEERRRSQVLDVPAGEWMQIQEDFVLDDKTTNFDLLLEIPGDLGEKRNVVLFDDLRLIRQPEMGSETIDINEAQKKAPAQVMLEKGEVQIRSTNEMKDAFVNIDAIDPSFEKSSWSESLVDCNRADERDLKTVGIDATSSDDTTDGHFSLSLSAKEHMACVSNRIESVQPNQAYVLLLDYKTIGSRKSARVRITFHPEVAPPQEELLPRRKEWATHEIPIRIPSGAESMDVILMTEGGGGVEQKNLFDRLRLQKTNYQQDQNLFVVASSEPSKSRLPSVSATRISRWKTRVQISGAEKPYLLVLDEFYHRSWRAQVESGERLPSEQHVIANFTKNGWLMDRPGDYTLVITFAPQQIFFAWIVIALLTFLIVVGAGVVHGVKKLQSRRLYKS